MKNNIIFGVFALIVIALVGYAYMNLKKESPQVACPADAQICSDGSSVLRTGPSCSFAPCPVVKENKYKDDLMVIDSPELNGVVTSPIQITGQAKGTFFYEGSFPILVTDSKGQIIGDGVATAQGAWATESLVPFTATIPYLLPSGSTEKTGTIILQSEDSVTQANPKYRAVPIVFSEAQ